MQAVYVTPRQYGARSGCSLVNTHAAMALYFSRLQVARAANNIRSLANVLIAAIPGFGNVLALIGLVLFMYSYVGVILFGCVAGLTRGDLPRHWCRQK